MRVGSEIVVPCFALFLILCFSSACAGEDQRLPDEERAETAAHLLKTGTDVVDTEPQKAIEEAERGLTLLDRDSSIELRLALLEVIATANFNLGRYAQAGKTAERLRQEAEAATRAEATCNALYMLGRVHESMSEFEIALPYFLSLLDLASTTGYEQGVANAHHGMGNVYALLKQNEQALEHYIEAQRLFAELGDRIMLGKIVHNSGYVYEQMERYKSALDQYAVALEIGTETNDQSGISFSLHCIGRVHRKAGQYQQALPFLKHALEIRRRIDLNWGVASTLEEIGTVSAASGDFESAITYTREALDLAVKIGARQKVRDCHETLSRVYAATGRFEEALHHYQLFKTEEDEILNARSAEMITEMRVQYETDKKARENELLMANSEIQEEKIRRQSIVSWSVSLGLAVVMLLLLLTIRANLQKKRAYAQLQQRNDKIALQARALSDANEKLLQLDLFKRSITAMIVHDLKNPLGAIINATRNSDDHGQQMINQSGRLMLNLVMNILDVQKYETIGMKPDLESSNMLSLAQHAIDQVQFLLLEKNIRLEVEIAEWLTVDVDRAITGRVLVNLLTNAIKYSPQSSTIKIVGALANDVQARVEVRDSGGGIKDDEKELVFEMNRQSSPLSSGRVGSTGVGLTFCRMAIEAHGGKIGVVSERGEGATFWFTVDQSEKVETVADDVGDLNESESLVLTASEKEVVRPLVSRFEALDVHDLGELRALLQMISAEQESSLYRWKAQLQGAVHTLNEERYRALTSPAMFE